MGSAPPDEGQIHTPASEAHSLNRWTTREVPPPIFIFEKFISPEKCLESCNEHADGLYLPDPLSLSPVRVATATCNCVFNHLPSFKPQETSLYFGFQLLRKIRSGTGFLHDPSDGGGRTGHPTPPQSTLPPPTWHLAQLPVPTALSTPIFPRGSQGLEWSRFFLHLQVQLWSQPHPV